MRGSWCSAAVTAARHGFVLRARSDSALVTCAAAGVEFECFDDVHETNKDKVVGPPPAIAARPTASHAATAGVRSPNPVAQLTPAQPNYT